MKIARILLATLFSGTLLWAGRAHAAPREYGFAPLLTQSTRVVPARVQALEAYERMLPALVAGQQSGAILDFQPDFGAGVVSIAFAPGARTATLAGAQVYEDFPSVAAALPAPRATELVGAGAIYNPSFGLSLLSSSVQAEGLIFGDHVVASLRDRAGKVVGACAGYAGTSGTLRLGFNGLGPGVCPGYRVTIKVYDTGGALRGTYSVVAPAIAFTALDKARSIARGTGPAGKAYSTTWIHANLDAGRTSQVVTRHGTVPASGTWSADYGTTPFRRGDYLFFDMSVGSRFTFSRYLLVPYSDCQLETNYCGVAGFPNRPAAITIVHAGVTYPFTGRFDLWGGFRAMPVDAAGMPVLLKAGDTVSATDSGTRVLPALTASIDFATDVVSGRAPAGRYFNVTVEQLGTGAFRENWAHANADGTYAIDFTSQMDLIPTEAYFVAFTCVDPVSGNRTGLYRAFGP